MNSKRVLSSRDCVTLLAGEKPCKDCGKPVLFSEPEVCGPCWLQRQVESRWKKKSHAGRGYSPVFFSSE